MTQEHSITPPPELVQQWRNGGPSYAIANNAYEHYIATQAARWGADQELEATLGLMATLNIRGVDYVRNARRSARAPSLKEEALKQLQFLQQCGAGHRDTDKILRALEQLSD